MTVQYTGVSQTIDARSMIYPTITSTKAIAQAAMVSMAEADIDMLMDCPADYPTKESMERVFQGLHDQARDLIEDTFDELRERVLAELTANYTARITALHYNPHGEVRDIDLKIEFN
jgi:hypothetical protein